MRYYDPEIGSYISRDPAGYVDGLNVYLYVGNNPVNRIDPEGLVSLDEWGAAYSDPSMWWNSMASSSRNRVDVSFTATDGKNWVASGALLTAMELGHGLATIPQQLSQFGAGTGTYAGDPSLANAAGVARDVSTLATVAAVTVSALPSMKPTPVPAAANEPTAPTTQQPSAPTTKPTAPSTVQGSGANPENPGRLPQDVAVNPTPPEALPLDRPIGKSPAQNAELQKQIEQWQNEKYTDIRVNQQQVNAAGDRVGVNRPDLQGTSPTGQRVYKEYDISTSTRGPGHEARIKANDPTAEVYQEKVD